VHRIFVVVALSALAGPLLVGCPQESFPSAPKQCGEGGRGCLSDEVCVNDTCVKRPSCDGDSDCESGAYECVFPAQVCKLRAGFGIECSRDAPCGPGLFCALGVCRIEDEAQPCSNSLDCPPGQRCDAEVFVCIEDAPCTLAADFPEVACTGDEVCDVLTGVCRLGCQEECEGDEDCPIQGQRCDGACRCVQCISEDDCGAGLVCNVRAGRCQSENLCLSDLDCESPFICDPRTAQCQAAPPPCSDDFDCAIAEECNLETGRCELPAGPCTRDRFEDADTPASAEGIDVNAGATFFADDLVLCPDDDDVYSVVLLAGDVLVAEVTNTEVAARATVWLLDSSGETSIAFAEAPPRGDGRVQYFAQQDEVVFLRLNALLAQTPYALTVERQPGAVCAPDFFEGTNGNDTRDAATAPALVPDVTPISARICPGDEDYYRLNVAFGESVSATVSFDGAATDLDVTLLNSVGLPVVRAAGSEVPERVRKRFFSTEDVFVHVRGFGNQIGSYTLVIAHDPPFVCEPDAAEPNDELATATLVPLGGALAPSARTLCTLDVDLYALPLEDFERAVIQATYDDADLEARIEVLDATGSSVLATSPPGTGGAALSYDAQGNENVLVRVTGVGNAVGPYTLSITKENQLQCAPDAREPNETVMTAGALPAPSDLLTMCEPDADFFLVEGEAGKKLVANASFRHAEADIDLMLLGLDGLQVLAVADGTMDGESLEHVLPVDGIYTLRVFSATSGAKALYTLDVTQQSP
jgi:hypothetical protein